MYSMQVSVQKITVQGVVSGMGIIYATFQCGACLLAKGPLSTMFTTEKQFKFVLATLQVWGMMGIMG